LVVLASPDQARGLEAIEEIRRAQERIGTLELMLARARARGGAHRSVIGVGNPFGTIPNDEPIYDPDLAAEGRARGWRG
jgi:hypothetical protein